MKKIIYITIIFFVLSGCTEMLDQSDPTGSTGDDFFKTERDVQLAVVAAYGGLTNGLALWGGDMEALEQLSDNVYNGSTLTDGNHATWHLFQITPDNGCLVEFYQYLYIAVNRANQVLKNAPEIEGISQSALDNCMGQAYFLRGYEYFLLTLIFGDAPIVLEPPTDPTGFAVAASPSADVYAQIVDDLEKAEQLLPATQPEAGRIVKLAATAMLAKVYLFGADELQQAGWYALARQKAEQVIDSNNYALVNDPEKTPTENFKDVFSLGNENGPEDIFAVQHFNDGSASGNGNVATNFPMQISPRYNRSYNIWGYGWGYVYESVLKQWNNDDARKDVTLWINGENIYLNDVKVGTYQQNKQSRANARIKGGGVQKFWWAENFKSNNLQSDYNMKVIRYADLLLVHAEADLMADGTISAKGLASINAVRNRAGLPGLQASEVDRTVILNERRWELFGEVHRWFDLMRTKTAEQAFVVLTQDDTDGDDNDKSGFVGERYYKLPYPQKALDRNPLLVQKAVWANDSE